MISFVQAAWEAIADFIGLPTQPAVAGALAATAEVNTRIDPELKNDPLLSGSVPVVVTKTLGPADLPPATETGKAVVPPPVTLADTPTDTLQGTPTERTTGNEQTLTDTTTLTKEVTDTAEADEKPTEPKGVSAPKLSASAEPAKHPWRAAKPRTVVRDSLGAGEQLRDLAHRGNGGRPTTRTADADDEKTAKSSSIASSPAASSSKGSASGGGTDGGESDGGDADGSE